MKRMFLPRIVRHVDEYRFIFPAVAWAYVRATPGVAGALFSVAVGWWRWHVEFIWQNARLEPEPASGDRLRADLGRCVSCCGEAHEIIQWTDAGPKQYGAECSICGRRIAEENPAALIAAFAAANAEAHGRAVARTVQPLVGGSSDG